MPDRQGMAKQTFNQAVVKVSLFVIGFVALVVALTPSEEEIAAPKADRAADPTSGSKAACREFIKQVLVLPSTADFGHFAAWQAGQTDSGSIRVIATFDVQNAYGSMIRQTMTCEARKADGQWRLESLTEG